jgi:hypothetical protein
MTDLKITNPLTKKKVLVSGKVGQGLIKMHKTGEIVLSSTDIDQLVKNGLIDIKQEELSKKKINKKDSPHTKVELSDTMKKKLIDYVKYWKDKESLYLDENHKMYCRKNDINYFNKLLIENNNTIFVPLSKLIISPSLQLDLKGSNANMSTKLFALTSMKTNNYKTNHLLYKNPTMIDLDWIKELNAYIVGLPIRDVYTLHGYTYHGDVIVNNFLMGTIDFRQTIERIEVGVFKNQFFPLFFQCLELMKNPTSFHVTDLVKKHLKFFKSKTSPGAKYNNFLDIAPHLKYDDFWKPAIELYINDLDRIIANAPPLKKPMTVYRGITKDYFLEGKKGFLYKSNTFVSTSLSLDSALTFKNDKDSCCLKRITLLPGTRTMMMSGVSKYEYESEFLLGRSSKFYITKERIKLYKTPSDKICTTDKDAVYVSDIVII